MEKLNLHMSSKVAQNLLVPFQREYWKDAGVWDGMGWGK